MGGAASVGFAGGLGLRLRDGTGLCFWADIGMLLEREQVRAVRGRRGQVAGGKFFGKVIAHDLRVTGW